MTAVSPVASTSGNATGTSVTVTFPTYTTGDALLLIVSRTQTETNPFTFSSSITSITELANTGTRRLVAMLVTPNGTGQTTATLTSVTTATWSWWFATYRGYDLTAAVNNATNAIGNSTSSLVTVPATQLGYIATGHELVVSAAGVNSTATWTTDANTVFNTTSGNAALMVDATAATAGALTATPANMDRGNNGSTRNQNSLSFVLQADPLGTVNLLSNPSFETNTSGLATGWTDEHTTVVQPTYTSTTSGVVDGTVAQKIVYTGQSGDSSTKFEIYQAPISGMSPGDTLVFSVWLSGSLTNVYGFIGIEAFDSSNTYISEQDTNFTALTSTPTQYSVSYTCPTGTDHVAVYLQVPGVGPTGAASIILDAATLTKATASNASVTGPAIAVATALPGGIVAVSSSVSLTGSPAALTVAAPAGTVSAGQSVSVTGTPVTLAVASPSGTVSAVANMAVTGPTIGLSLTVPPGGVTAGGSVTITGTPFPVATTTVAGTITAVRNLSVTGAPVTLTTVITAGSVFASRSAAITGPAVSVALTAVAGSVRIAAAGRDVNFTTTIGPRQWLTTVGDNP